MSKNSESLNRSLYALLRGKGYKPKMLTTSGKASPVPEEAAVFLFHFIKDGKDYGQVSASIDGAKKLIVYFDDEVADSPDTNTSGTQYSDSWTNLVQQLSKWRFSKGLRSFELKNQDHLEPDMAQREHMNKKENVTEGYHAMGKQASYSDSVPNVKIVIQHSRKIEEGEQRYRNIARIFVENLNGERFLIPTTKPGIAQVYARHIAEGGTPYDDRAQHINSLVEEHSKMAGFVRATRNGQFNESTQRLVQEGVNHYHNLRETLGKMRGHRGYSAYFESWTPSLMEDESDTSNINELFVQETVDPRIESVMPILSKLQKNLGESSMKEVDQLAEWADSLLEGGDGGEASEEKDVKTAGDAGEGGAEDSPEDDLDDLAEGDGGQEALNPVGIPESDDDVNPVVSAITRRILLQRTDLLSKYGPAKVMQAIDDVADFVGDTDEIGSSDVSGWVRQVEQSCGGDLEESALQASFGIKKYGKKGMDALRKAGQEHASEKKMQNIRAKFSNKEKEVDEGLDADQKRVGQLGPTEKVKNNNIGKLVGANEGVLDNIRNKMQSGSMLNRVRSGAYKAPTAAPTKASPPGYDTETGKPLPPEARFDPHTGKPLPGVAPVAKTTATPTAKPAASRTPLPSAQAAAQPRPARSVADLTAPRPATGPTELPSDWKFGQAVPSTVWKAGDDPNKNPNNPIIVHMVKVRDAMTKRGYGDTQSVQDKITRASRGQAFDPSGFQAWVDESENFEENFIGMAPQAVAEGQEDLDAILRIIKK
jgi:hypothetical protein